MEGLPSRRRPKSLVRLRSWLARSRLLPYTWDASMKAVSWLTCSRCCSRSKKTAVAPEPQAALLRVNSMQRLASEYRGSCGGIGMGKQGGADSQEEPQVWPVPKVSRLTASREWSRSWSRNWPHCITMWVSRGSGVTLAAVMSREESSRAPGLR